MEKTTPDYPDHSDYPGDPPDGEPQPVMPSAAYDGAESEAGENLFEDRPQQTEDVPGLEGSADPEQIGAAARSTHLIREIMEVVLIVVLVFLGVRSAVRNFMVEGDSMLPTLHTGQYLLVNRAIYTRYDANFLGRLFNNSLPADMRYLFQQPQRGDIVVFEAPTAPRDFIKRVIAVEGETVEVRADADPVGRPGRQCGGCGVYVDGVLLDEPYIRETPDYNVPPTLVPPGHVFVLGDNRRNSEDSHVFGPLAVDRLVGAAFLSYLPLDSLGFLPHPTYARASPTPQP